MPIWGERADELDGSEFRLREMAGWERVGEGSQFVRPPIQTKKLLHSSGHRAIPY